MTERTIIAVVLSFLILLGYNIWYQNRYADELKRLELEEKAQLGELTPQQPVEPAPQQQTAAVADPAQSAPSTQAAPTQTAATEPQPVVVNVPAGMAAVGSAPMESAEQLVTVNTGVSKVTITSRGARIQSLAMLDYIDPVKKAPVDLVAGKIRPLDDLPAGLEFMDAEFTKRANTGPYEHEFDAQSAKLFDDKRHEAKLTDLVKTATLSFGYRDPANGWVIRKEYTFTKDSYVIGLKITIDTGTGGASAAGAGFQYGLIWTDLGFEETEVASWAINGPIVYLDGKRIAKNPDAGDKPYDYAGNIGWAGLVNQYYCMVALPHAPKSDVSFSALDIAETTVYRMNMKLAGGAGATSKSIEIYAGPKKYDILKNLGHDLKKVINFGYFDIIAKPLFYLLEWLHGYLGNWGWAIIFMTVIVKVLFYPLSQSGMKSMEKLRLIQPKMKQIQERYKNDKDKLNEEMINLYRSHGVNPLGGCLPIVIQIPVFFSLYKVLIETIELKGAPFMFWIHDLSAADPYYVSPLLMGVSMFVQQKMTPSSMDPVQARMMLLMPIVFTFLFLNFPAGLVIYWLVNNVLSIMQQYWMKRHVEAEAVAKA